MSDFDEAKTPNQRLDSWKEIAAFFRRDERTVKRWEKERGLPVHRLQGSATGRVYAGLRRIRCCDRGTRGSGP